MQPRNINSVNLIKMRNYVKASFKQKNKNTVKQVIYFEGRKNPFFVSQFFQDDKRRQQLVERRQQLVERRQQLVEQRQQLVF